MKLSLGLSPRDYSVAGGAVAYDADALAYFTANTAITNDADKNAINTFYLGLKSDGIYTKIKAMYLPIWGSAASCKWNLVNPLDTNAAFRLTFSVGWTYSSSGITPTNAYADTFLNLNANGNASGFISIYSRTAQTGTNQVDCGVFDTTGSSYSYLQARSSNLFAIAYNNFGGAQTISENDGKGFFICQRITTNGNIEGYKNGTRVINVTSVASGGGTNLNFYLGSGNLNGSPNYYSLKQQSFYCLGAASLSTTEASNLSSRVNTLMTYFGINVY